jgi:hypothetical protein
MTALKKTSTEPAELFASYQDALAASDAALTDAKAAADQLLAARVTTDEQASWASTVGHQVAAVRKALESKRDTAKRPWYDAYQTIQKSAKPAVDLLTQIERHLKSEIGAHECRKAELQALAMPEATSREEIAAAAAIMSPAPEGVQVRERWIWEAADGGHTNLDRATALLRGLDIPDMYWVLDKPVIDRLVKAHKGNLSEVIPGLRGKLDPTIAFTS